eukprot:359586-Chlamydomonas_euryale.AAC.14
MPARAGGLASAMCCALRLPNMVAVDWCLRLPEEVPCARHEPRVFAWGRAALSVQLLRSAYRKPKPSSGAGLLACNASCVMYTLVFALHAALPLALPFQLGRNELDHKIVAELAAYDPEDGVRILGQFENAGLENVRNKSGYLHG